MPIAPSVARDILLAVRSQHWLSKYQVVRAWRLSGDEYSSLEKELAREADIIVDSSHSGFRVRAGKAELDGPSEERTVFVAPRGANAPPASSGRTENAGDIAESGLRKNAPVWQQAAATRLAELLTAATLSDLVGPLEKAAPSNRRWASKHESGARLRTAHSSRRRPLRRASHQEGRREGAQGRLSQAMASG